MAKINDLEQIITGCKNGDNKSFALLIDIYSKRCYGYFYRLTGNRNTSDDLLSELFLKLVAKIKTFRSGSFDCWLFTIASNIFKDYLRSKFHRKKLLEAQKQSLQLQKGNKSPDGELFDKLQTKLNELDTETKEVILLRFYSQLSFKEIAEMRCEPIGTTLSKLHRGLKKLRELMG
ncbi:MAG: RNA polymerase sigma factor [Planctomycetota bacterium]|jgi:RNA polymerase sigma-70 factor (ECF subfamily)